MLVLVGCLAGAATGMIPGIHPNTVVFSSLPVYLSSGFDFLSFACLITGISVSHTFHDFLPSIFLGIAEAETALSAVPGAEMAARGKGLEAFRLTVAGGLVSLAVFIAAFLPLWLFLDVFYSLAEPVMEYLLLFFLLFAVFKSRKEIRAAAVALLSGTLGVLAFRMPLNQDFVLVPVFAGLFAVPALLAVLEGRIRVPEQRGTGSIRRKDVRGGAIGFLAGLVSGVVPGVGAATSTASLTPLMESEEEFLAAMGAVNTSDLLVSLLALQLIGKARSGTAVALSSIKELDIHLAAFLTGAALVGAGLSSVLALNVSANFCSFLRKLEPLHLVVLAAVPLLLLVYVFTGFAGLLVLFAASCIGVAARECSARAACMACLIVPAIMYYVGFSL